MGKKFLLFVFIVFFHFYKTFAQTPSTEGEWSPVLNMGIVPVAAANLPDG
ncbi:hypothetical protein SAMN04488009_3749, partial [Maribacter sedimenticola]